MITHCRAHLGDYKVPRRVEFTDEFPMTATGKIQKFTLRDRVVEQLGLAELAGRRLLDHRSRSGDS